MDTIIQPVIRPAKRGGYRRHTDEFKRAVVAQSLLADASVSRIAREHNINANQVFAWRKLFREGQSSSAVGACTLLPVTLAAVAAPVLPASCAERSSMPTGIIELTVGKAQLRLEGAPTRRHSRWCCNGCCHDRLASKQRVMDVATALQSMREGHG